MRQSSTHGKTRCINQLTQLTQLNYMEEKQAEKKSILEGRIPWLIHICAAGILFYYYGRYHTEQRRLDTQHRIEILHERKSAYLEGLADGVDGYNLDKMYQVLNERLPEAK